MTAVTAPTLAPQRLPAVRRTRSRYTARQPYLSVVLVNYCQWRNTTRLTKQLRQSRAARTSASEIVIVDNHSPRHPLLGKLRRAEGVSLRRFPSNRGFGRAVNEGVRLSQGEWLLLLNPDTSVPPGFLDQAETLARTIQRDDPAIGIIGLGVRNSDGSPQASCGPLPTLFGTLAGLLLPRAVRKCRPLPAANRTAVPWATGCALLIRRDCLKQIGGFDEDFFLYYEDVDLCQRAAERGWKICYEPGLQVTHHTPLHSRRVPAPLRLMTRHALLTYAVKHWPRWQARLLGGIIRIESRVRQIVSWFRGRKEDALTHGAVRRLVGDVLAGRTKQARARIRSVAENLEESASAQDGRTC